MPRRNKTWSKVHFLSFLLLCVANLDSVVSLPVRDLEHVVTGNKLKDAFAQKYDPTFAEDTFNPWNIYADYEMHASNDMPLLNKELSERSLKRSISYFYPLRGKKEDDYQPESSIDKKASLSLYPMRGKKAKMMVLIPTRGKKESEESNYETNLQVRSDQNPFPDFHFPAESADNIAAGDNVGTKAKSFEDDTDKFGVSQGSFQGAEEKMENDEREEQMKREFREDVKVKKNQRGKRRILPFIKTWRLFQKVNEPGAPRVPREGNKREALFFASRGKRSSDNSAIVSLALQP